MVKYYCNKCGTEIKRKILRVQTADDSGNKQSYHLCNDCSVLFMDFMSMNKSESDDPHNNYVIENVSPSGSNESEVKSSEINASSRVVTAAEEGNTISNLEKDKPKSGRQVKYMTDENKKFINENRSEMSTTEISRHLGIPYWAVYQYIRVIEKNYKEVDAKPTSTMSVSEAGQCVALRRAGWSVKDISGDMGKTAYEVEEALKLNGM